MKNDASEEFLIQTGAPVLHAGQLNNIKTRIDLVLLALEAIAGIGSDAMLAAARELGVDAMVSDRVSLWRLRQSNPIRKGSGGRKKLDVEEARSLVLVICYLARAHQATIRQAVQQLERATQAQKPPHHHPILGDFLDRFTNSYQDRMEAAALSSEQLTPLAFKLLIDLLFYGGRQGVQRLWLALLEGAAGGTSAGASAASTKVKRPAPDGDESVG
ncbi:DUF3038 domain-containing protein [Lyngbya confervoides]|uniref:DUF3038 domain-containing protein n=1 Tax=Lyngbya confervoides BDU141951 TaxID=1574623 RepID=A0ABD4SXP3_9CYAN|nr:DUF3038 domain-containing protein [Lyngbya confervoides]MCM1981351.1 DUF3038 domain-containing protein [Lyngbya confervoides BDU141951]